jgi:two-component system response regulator HydG
MRVLLAEDRSSLRQALSETLRRSGYEVLEAPEGRTAMALVDEGGFDLAIFDLKMPVHSGIDLLKASKGQWPLVPVIVLTAYGSVDLAVEAMKAGAADFLGKPVDADHLLLLVQRALDAGRRGRVTEALESDVSRLSAFQEICGSSAALREAKDQAARIAGTDTTCLLLGETGVGKELFARAVHKASPRVAQPFVAVNCAAIPSTLLENELFGHEKGAYTGAHESRMGRFELAHRGTMFLDEIGEMGFDLQAKLLRVLEEKTFTRVGGPRPISVDVRVICATNRNLEQMVAAKTFREDLYYRLSAFPIRIPPLRERPEDIPELAERFIDHFRRDMGKAKLHLSDDAASYLASQPWPGNVRELMNRIERASILAGPEGGLDRRLLEGAGRGGPPPLEPPPFMEVADPEEWLEAETAWRTAHVVKRCEGDRRRAARLLGMTLQRLNELVGDG